MSQKFRFSLKMKVITLIACLLGATLSFFTTFSVNLFKEDKAAYIYETSLATSESIQGRLDESFAKIIRDYLLLENALNSSDDRISRSLFASNPNFIFLKSNNKTYRNLQSEEESSLDLLVKGEKRPVGESSNGFQLSLVSKNNKNYFHLQKKGSDIQIIIKEELVLLPLEENKIYDSFILSSSSGASFPEGREFQKEIFNVLEQSPVAKSVKEINLEGDTNLLSYSKLRSLNLFVVSLIKNEKAFKAAEYLTKKSLYFGVMVLGIGIILGVLFSRSLTRPLETLHEHTMKIAKGDFSGQVEVKTRDEIGSLGNSFNFMSAEILRYMEEMKEKARLENEVAVAKLVQDSFFPEMNYQSEGLDISAFYKPASECGGDWFQFYQHNNKTIVLMADATGHGVPAAFLTASIFTAFNTVVENANDELLNHPGKLLAKINNVICRLETNLFLTCFALVFSNDTGELIYSNASHLEPFLINKKDTYSKSDLIPLMEAKGSRLGHEMNSDYPEASLKLEKNDTLILMTDGILESINSEEKQYGQRKFIKSLCENLNKDTIALKDSLIGDLKEFCGEIPFDDDVSLIAMRTKI